MQYVKFPMSTLRITQGYGLKVDGISTSVSGGTYSHTGSYALDLGGADTGADYLYAPCDVTVMRHYKGSGYNAVWYQTNEEVMCADGQARQLVFMLLHANDSVITELGITTGKTFAQGEVFYKEGTGGGVSTHVHLEVGLAPFTGTGWYQSEYVGDYNGANVWIINNKLIPSEIFYLTDEINVVEDMGYNWRYLTDTSYIEYSTPTGVRILSGTGKNVEYFNSADVNDVAGGGLPEGSEYVAVGYTAVADSNGFTYVKFIYSDGNEYWMAMLEDRIELFERNVYVEYTTSMKVKVLEDSSKTVEYFNTPNVNDVVGSLPKGTEYVALGHTTVADENGFTYIKFTHSDGNDYWMAMLEDRVELFEENGISGMINQTFFIQANDTDFYLNVHGVDTVENERNVNIYSKEDVLAQRWVIKETSGGLKLFTKIDETFALNIYTIDDNCSMYTAAGNDADSVLDFELVGDMLYRIKMSSYNKYLCVDGAAASGTNVVWAEGVSTATVWKFVSENEAFPDVEEPTPTPDFTEEGIDVSDYQGIIDWTRVAATGQKFAILKAVGTNTNGIYISNYWEDNYQGAKNNGIKVGAYLYTYAFNKAEAEEELTYLLQALKGKQFEYPIFIDVEDKLLYQNCTKEEITNTVKYLCTRLKEEGYYPAVYTYTYFAHTYLNMDDLAEYDTWIADYTGEVTYTGDYTIWQYTSTGSVDGIEGNVDMNISYKDYKTIIENERLNGFMAITNAKTLNVRIKNKYDSYENWAASGLVLEAGEIAIAYTTVNVEVGNGKIEQHPELLMKVGDGSKTFKDLPWLSAKAADVAAWAKAANKPTYSATEITGIADYIKDYVEDTMGITTDTNDVFRIVKESDYKYKLQSKAKLDADSAWADVADSVIVIPNDTAAIEALQGLVGEKSVATQITEHITALDLANTYEAKGEAAKVQTALDTYKTSNDAAVQKHTTDIAANASAITAIKDGTTIDSFADVETALAGKQAVGDYATKAEAQGYANAKDTAIAEAKKAGTDAQTYAEGVAGDLATEVERATKAEAQVLVDAKAYTDVLANGAVATNAADIEALEGLVGTTAVADQISGYVDGLKLADTYAAKVHTHVKADITDFAHTHEMSEVNGLSEEFAKYQVKGDYATKAEAQAMADAKDEAIAAAQAAADKAQGEVDALEGVVGPLPEGETSVIAYINKKTEGIATDAALGELQGSVTNLETLVGGKAVATQISEAVEAEKDRAEGVENGLANRIKAVEDDYLKAADKTELTNAIATAKQEAIATVLGEGTDEDFDTLKEVADWILSDTTGAAALQTDVAAIKADYLKGADKTELEGKITTAQNAADKAQGEVDALEKVVAGKAAQTDLEAAVTRIGTVEGKVATLEGEMDTAQADIEALEGLVGTKSVATQITEATTPIQEALDVVEGKVEVLEGKMAAAEGDIDALETEVAKKANTADLADIAFSGSTDDLVQGTMTLVFDCGNASV